MPPEASIEPSRNHHSLAPTVVVAGEGEKDELTHTVMGVCHLDDNALTSSARGALNKALTELREVGATPDQVRYCKDRWREKWPNGELTPLALAKHWPMLKAAAPQREEWEQ